MRSGQLIIRPTCAKLLHDTEMFGKMSPYVKVIIGDQTEKTDYAKKGHMAPTWEDSELKFNVLGDEMIIFELWHHEMILKDDFIGKGTLSLSAFLGKGTDTFSEWVPLIYKEADAGSLQVSFQFFPDKLINDLPQNATLSTIVESTQQNEAQENQLAGTQENSLVETQNMLTQPVTTTQTRVVTHEPIYTHGNPEVYEKNIIREKPIITERTIVHSEQPIIIEKPELHETIVNEQLAPETRTEHTIIRQEEGFMGEKFEGTPVIHSTTEYVQDQAEFHKETPIIHQKDVILEKPIIHEKDIVYREKPIIVEKPEIVERHIFETQAPVTQTHDTVFHKHEESTNYMPELGDHITHREDAEINRAEPQYRKELPDVHETEVIHEKRMVHEKPIVHTEKEVIHERPEVHEKRIFHQDETIRQRDPLIKQEGMPDEGIVNQPRS